jgi:hypothetical protein
MKKMLGWTMVAMVSLGSLAACSSDSKSSSTTKATTPAANSTAASSSGESSGSAAVDEFCKQSDDLAAKLKDVIKNPTSANAADVTAAATKLSSDAAALISANPGDSAKIQACVKKLTDAATPNG